MQMAFYRPNGLCCPRGPQNLQAVASKHSQNLFPCCDLSPEIKPGKKQSRRELIPPEYRSANTLRTYVNHDDVLYLKAGWSSGWAIVLFRPGLHDTRSVAWRDNSTPIRFVDLSKSDRGPANKGLLKKARGRSYYGFSNLCHVITKTWH